MRRGQLGAGLAAWAGALLLSLCCLLPLAVIALGLGSGAFVAVTMRYRWILIPTGVLGIVSGFALYWRERKRCDTLGCRMAGSKITFAPLMLASLVVITSIALDRFSEMTSDLLARVTERAAHDMSGGDMPGMERKATK
jgi:mercuric ion transport protein